MNTGEFKSTTESVWDASRSGGNSNSSEVIVKLFLQIEQAASPEEIA